MDRSTLRVLAVILLVVLMLVLGLPLGVGMAPMAGGHCCPDCDGAVGPAVLACVAILVSMLLIATAIGSTVVATRSFRIGGLFLRPLDRPPRPS